MVDYNNAFANSGVFSSQLIWAGYNFTLYYNPELVRNTNT